MQHGSIEDLLGRSANYKSLLTRFLYIYDNLIDKNEEEIFFFFFFLKKEVRYFFIHCG